MLYKELEQATATLNGSASLATDEEAIELRLVVGKTGAVQVTGRLKDSNRATIEVTFDYPSDQSFMAQTLSELKDLQERWE